MPTAITPTLIGSKYAVREQAIRNLFTPGTTITHDGQPLRVIACGKPHVSGGETKTDVFIAAENMATGARQTLKISFKLHSAEFIENKLNAARAAEVLGANYADILREAATALNIDRRTFHNSRKRTYVLGYRLDIMVQARNRNKASPSYHPVELTHDALMRIYAGSDSLNNKQDAYVTGYNDGELVVEAGIADYILFDAAFTTAQQVIDQLIPIREYVRTNPIVYLAFKAVNFRMDKYDAGYATAWDGNRPLAYAVTWTADNATMVGSLDTTAVMTQYATARGEQFKTLLSV